MKEHTARFDVGDLLYLALTLVVAGIGIAFGLNVLSETKEDLCGTGYTYNTSANNCYLNSNVSVKTTTDALNATNDAITGVSKFTSKMGLIATVIVASVVIGILVRYLFVRK